MNEKLLEILTYYRETYEVPSPVHEVYEELIANDVQVEGDSFYCPIWNEQLNAWILLAGTKERADMWVLKKIIHLIKTGETIHTMFNGNADYLLEKFSRYNLTVTDRLDNGIMFLKFN